MRELRDEKKLIDSYASTLLDLAADRDALVNAMKSPQNVVALPDRAVPERQHQCLQTVVLQSATFTTAVLSITANRVLNSRSGMEVCPGENQYHEDRRGDEIDSGAERWPPPGVAHEPRVVLPKVFQPVCG